MQEVYLPEKKWLPVRASLLLMGSCLTFIALGFVLLSIFAVNEADSTFKYIGLALVFIPALAFRLIANFLDKASR